MKYMGEIVVISIILGHTVYISLNMPTSNFQKFWKDSRIYTKVVYLIGSQDSNCVVTRL